MDNIAETEQRGTRSPFPPEAIALADKVASLASLPGTCVRVMSMAETPDVSATDIGEVVSLDPGLSARLLKLVNSAYFALPRKVDSIAEAIRIAGTNALRNLALATGALSAFEGIPNAIVDMESFWSQSVYCALAARELGRIARLRDPERGFICGLLHAIGQLVMYSCEPAKSLAVLTALRRGERARAGIEANVFGCSHAEVGAALLAAWRVPESIVVPVRYQMSPADADPFRAETATLAIAASLAEACGTAARSTALGPDAAMARVPAEIWLLADLAPEVTAHVVEEIDALWFDVIEILSPGATLID